VSVKIGYVYPAVPLAPSDEPNFNVYDQEFGHYSYFGVPASTNPGHTQITLYSQWQGSALAHWVTAAPGAQGVEGLGGWTLSVHHTYDPGSGTLFLGDGRRRNADTLPAVVQTIFQAFPNFTQGPINVLTLTVGPDGAIYFGSQSDSGGLVWRIGPDGSNLSLVAGGCGGGGKVIASCGIGDGGPATSAFLGEVDGLAFGPDGSFYIVSRNSATVRRVDPAGVITTFAGDNNGLDSNAPADGVPAIGAGLGNPSSVAVAPDGSVYIYDISGRLLRVSTDGFIRIVLQRQSSSICTSCPPAPSGVPLSDAYLHAPSRASVSVGQDGTVYVVDGDLVRSISPSGIFSTLAGNGNLQIPGGIASLGIANDGQAATSVPIGLPNSISVGSDGTVFYDDEGLNGTGFIKGVRPDGLVFTVAGNGANSGPSNGIATALPVLGPLGVAISPDGSLFAIVTNQQNLQNIVHIRSPIPRGSVSGFQIADESGTQVYTFDATGRHFTTTDAFTGATIYSFTYDSGRLASVTDVNSDPTIIQRDSSGSPIAIVSPLGPQTALSVGPNGYLASVRDPAGNIYGYQYDGGGLLQTTTTPRGGQYSYSYDAQGRLLEELDPSGGGARLVNVKNSQGNAVTRTTLMGVASTYQVNTPPSGDILQTVVGPEGLASTFNRGIDSTSIASSPDGTVTATALAADPRFSVQAPVDGSVTVTTPSGLVSRSVTTRSVTLSNPNDLLSVLTATTARTLNGSTWTRTFSAGPPMTWTATSPVGRVATTIVDAAGRPLQTSINATPPVTPVSFLYDSHGRLQQMTQGARTWTTGYDANGYANGQTDPLNHTVSSVNDLDGRPLTTTLQDLRQVGTSWDGDSNMLSITLPGALAIQPDPSREHQFSFTPVDLTQSYAPPSIGVGIPSTSYSYDADRFLTSTTRPDGVVVTHVPDAFERLSQIQYPQGALSYGYSPTTGQLLTTTTPGGETTTFTYDGFLQSSITWSGPVAGAIVFGYNTDFRVNSQSLNGGTSLSFGYDNDGLVNLAGALTVVPDPQNGRISATILGAIADAYGYDSFGQVASYSANYSGSAIYAETFVSRDLNGRITEKKDAIAGATHDWVYAYDPAGRLTDVTEDGNIEAHYGYDGDDNRTTFTNTSGTVNPTYDVQDRLLMYGGTSYAYSANGELTSKTVNGQVTSFIYDALGNLLHVGFPAALADGTQTIDYVVDGQNRRVGKMVNGTLSQGWLYQDQLRPVAQLDGTGTNVVARFVYGSKANVPDYMVTSGGTYRILSDHLGSPRAVVDVASGNLIETINFDEFGNESDVLAGTLPTGYVRIPFGFAGGLYDPDTTLVRFGARDYDASVGRWTAKDPIRFGGGDNLYGYVLNDPVNIADMGGLKPNSFSICDIPFIGLICSGGWEPPAPDCTLPDCLPSPPPNPNPPPPPPPAMCTEPKNPRDCAAECEPYIGPAKRYRDRDGLVWQNDLRGNAQYAYYKCLEECEEGM
jgi:RHS repeat-associated protein